MFASFLFDSLNKHVLCSEEGGSPDSAHPSLTAWGPGRILSPFRLEWKRNFLDDILQNCSHGPRWEMTEWMGLQEPKHLPLSIIPFKMKKRFPQVFIFPAFICFSPTGASFLGLRKYLQGKETRCLFPPPPIFS